MVSANLDLEILRRFVKKAQGVLNIYECHIYIYIYAKILCMWKCKDLFQKICFGYYFYEREFLYEFLIFLELRDMIEHQIYFIIKQKEFNK